MSDAKLRSIQRVWQQTRSPDDEVAFINELMRSGAVARERVELAAGAGSDAACAALGIEPGLAPRDLVQWVRTLSARSVIPAALAVRSMITDEDIETAGRQELSELKCRFDEWVRSPTSESADLLFELGQGQIRSSPAAGIWRSLCMISMALSLDHSNDARALIMGAAALFKHMPDLPTRLTVARQAILTHALDLDCKPMNSVPWAGPK